MNPNYKVLILGDGWLAGMLAPYLTQKGYEVTHFKKYIEGEEVMEEIHHEITVHDIIINLLGKTNIDWCENNKLDAYDSNVQLPLIFAEICNSHNKYFVHFSSSCVFQSKDMLDWKDEDSEPQPACFYTETKLMAEKIVLATHGYTLVPRIRLPLSQIPHPRNTITKVLGYEKLNDTQESVTVVEDMLPVLTQMIEGRKTGIMHLINEGTISPSQIAQAFGHPHEIWSKQEQDEYMRYNKRAKRVTCYIKSKRIPLLPPILERMNSIARLYKMYV